MLRVRIHAVCERFHRPRDRAARAPRDKPCAVYPAYRGVIGKCLFYYIQFAKNIFYRFSLYNYISYDCPERI